MLLTEFYKMEEKKFKLDYLMEYLIVAENISLKESNQLIYLIEQMHQDVEKQTAGWFKIQMAKLTEKYKTLISNARKEVVAAKNAGKSPKVIQSLLVKVDNLKQSFSMAKNNLIQRFKNIQANNLEKMTKSKKLVNLKKLPKGKIAAGIGALAVAGGGYAAYRARQKKLAAAKA